MLSLGVLELGADAKVIVTGSFGSYDNVTVSSNAVLEIEKELQAQGSIELDPYSYVSIAGTLVPNSQSRLIVGERSELVIPHGVTVTMYSNIVFSIGQRSFVQFEPNYTCRFFKDFHIGNAQNVTFGSNTAECFPF